MTQVAAEREKHTVLFLNTFRATSTRFLVGCHGGRSSSQCPACGVSCLVVSTYHSITPTHTVTYYVLCNQSARLRMRAFVYRDEMLAESVDMRKRRYFFIDVLLWYVLSDIYMNCLNVRRRLRGRKRGIPIWRRMSVKLHIYLSSLKYISLDVTANARFLKSKHIRHIYLLMAVIYFVLFIAYIIFFSHFILYDNSFFFG